MEILLDSTEGDGLMRQFCRSGVLVRVIVLLAAAWLTSGLATAQPLGHADPATADRLAALERALRPRRQRLPRRKQQAITPGC